MFSNIDNPIDYKWLTGSSLLAFLIFIFIVALLGYSSGIKKGIETCQEHISIIKEHSSELKRLEVFLWEITKIVSSLEEEVFPVVEDTIIVNDLGEIYVSR